MVERVWWNGSQNTHPCLHIELEIWWNGAVQIIKRWNGVMVKRLYSPLTSFGLLVPSNDGDLSRLFTSLPDVSSVDEKVVSEPCRSDCLNSPWAPTISFNALSPWFASHHLHHRGVQSPFVPSCIFPLLSVILLAIYNYLTIVLYYRSKQKFHMEAVVTT